MRYFIAQLKYIEFLSGLALCFISPARAEPNQLRALGLEDELTHAVGVVDVYPFEDRNRSLQCTTFHLGDRYMATAGHCFLGSYDCNNAQVRWAYSEKVSRCTRVVYSFASESIGKIQATNRDLTIFQVDSAPAQKLNVNRDSLESMRVQSLSATGLSVQVKRRRVTSSATAPCTLRVGTTSTIFGQPKPKDSVQHNCRIDSFSAGAPILDANTGELLAIQQSSAVLPALDNQSETYIKEINYAKILTSLELLKIIHSDRANLRHLSIGGFAPEVFDGGFHDHLNLRVATLGAENGVQSVSFILHNGVDSQVEIIDGDGLKTLVRGPRRANLEQRIEFKAPVQVILKSTNNVFAPVLWLEDIEHN